MMKNTLRTGNLNVMDITLIETIIKQSCKVSYDEFKHSVHNSPFDTIDAGYIDDLLVELNINAGTKSMKKIMTSNTPTSEQLKVVTNMLGYFKTVTLLYAK